MMGAGSRSRADGGGGAADGAIGSKGRKIWPKGPERTESGLEVHEDGARDEAAAAGLVVVDERTLELEIGVADVLSGVVDAAEVGFVGDGGEREDGGCYE
jgi:hypothetical protein